MIEDLIKNSKNDEELIAFLTEFAKFSSNIELSKGEDLYDKLESKESSKEKPIKMKRNLKLSKKDYFVKPHMLPHQIINMGIDNFVDQAFQEEIKLLWDKNIYTKNVIVNDDEIKIVLDKLSPDNARVFEEQRVLYPENYIVSNGKVHSIVVKRKNKNKKKMLKIISNFEMQDVQTGFLTKEEFLMKVCNCEKVEGHSDIVQNKDLKIKFDENKMEKTFREYLEEKKLQDLYEENLNIIYLDKFYKDGHINYLNSNNKI